MKKYLVSAVAVLLLTSYACIAQQNDNNSKNKETATDNKKNKMKEYDEIVIKRKDVDKDTKVTIEIKDDEVLVDGKPIDQFENEDLSVKKRGANRYRMNVPPSPFRLEGGWSFDDNDMDLFDEGSGRAFLGVTTEGSSGGAKIISISENSAAAKAGLKKDDVITKINDKEVFDHEQLSDIIASFNPDDKVTITYKRDGKERKTTATLGKRSARRIIARAPRAPREPMAPMPPIPGEPPMVFNFDGDYGDIFQYRNARPRLGLKVQDTEDGKGVKVLDVDEGSAADKAGIKENDIITSFEGKDVNSATDLAKASREAKDKNSLKVQLNRNGKSQTIDVKVPKKLGTANL
jgi:serine protease Do